MKRNIIILLILIIAAGAAWYYLDQREEDKKHSFDFSYREFAVEDLDQVKKIVIAKRNEQAISFTRDGDDWLVNDTWKARENAMKNMLDAIKNIQIDYVPPNAATENIMKSFIRHGIKVELYDRKGEAIKKYYVGSSPADGMGSYYVMEGSNKPLVMALPSMKGNVHTRFSYRLNEWRDLTVLDISSDDIRSITLSYPLNRKFSFHLEGNELSPLHELQKPIAGNPSKNLIQTYLGGFESKFAEYLENENPKIDSLINQVPFCELSIKLRSGDNKDFRFFYHGNPIIEAERAKATYLDAFNPYHAERFFIQSNWGDIYLGQLVVFRDIFWKYDDFFEES